MRDAPPSCAKDHPSTDRVFGGGLERSRPPPKSLQNLRRLVASLRDRRTRRQLARKLANLLVSVPADLALRLANLAPVAARLERSYDLVRSQHRPVLPASLPEQAILAALAARGACVSHVDALGLGRIEGLEIVALAENLAREVAARAGGAAGWRPAVLASTPAELERHAALYRFGLHPVLLRIAEAYLGMPVAYDGAQLFNTIADGRETATRLWHLDLEDRRMLRIALYLHDVGLEDGPTEVVTRRARTPEQKFIKGAIDSAALERRLGETLTAQNVMACTGPKGSLVFFDPAGFFHRGRPSVSRDRHVLFLAYYARPPRHPFMSNRSLVRRHQVARMTEGLSQDQRAAAFWRDSVPWWVRWVPEARW